MQVQVEPLQILVWTQFIMIKSGGIEHSERYTCWLNELESLGIGTLEKNGTTIEKLVI